MRTSSRPARARTRLQGSKMLESRCPGLVPGMTQGLPGTSGDGGQNVRSLDGERDRAGAGLAVGKAQLLRLQVHLLPAERQDLVAPAAGEHEQADGRCRMGREPPRRLQLVQGAGLSGGTRRR